MNSVQVTLEQILGAREERVKRQNALINIYGHPLISFTINLPGPFKNTPLSRKIFLEGQNEVIRCLKENGSEPIYKEARDLITGQEAFFVVSEESCTLKKSMILLEDRHPLGRLWDFDVIGPDKCAATREMLGSPKRKCLICSNEAHACARSRAHTPQELTEKIKKMTEEYFKTDLA